jgi:Putative zinc-finger
MASLMDHANHSEPDFNALAAFVEDSLGRSERAQLLEHLASCERCRTIVAELARTRTATRPTGASIAVALPLAASLMVAVAGGGVYWLVRANSSRILPVVEPSKPNPLAPAQPVSGGATPGVSPSGRPASGRSAMPPDATDRTRGGGTRSVGGKTFRLVAGEWIDVEYRPIDALPIDDVRSREELEALDILRPFAALGRRFTVVVHDRVYRVAILSE